MDELFHVINAVFLEFDQIPTICVAVPGHVDTVKGIINSDVQIDSRVISFAGYNDVRNVIAVFERVDKYS